MSNGTTFPGQQDSPIPMLNTDTGWATAFGPQVLGRWSGVEQDVATTPLQWDTPLSIGTAFQGFVGGRFILGGIVSQSTPQWAEFDQTNGQLLARGDFGDRLTRWGAATMTEKGGLAGVLYADPMSKENQYPVNEVWLDAFYRPNVALPPSPSGTGQPPPWWFQRFKFPTTMGSVAVASMLFSVVQGKDGLLSAFYCRDSGSTINRTRFRIGSASMSLVDHDERFINEGLGDISPSGENLWVTAAVDTHNDRLLLAYQNQPHRGHPILKQFGEPMITSRYAITEVRYDGTVRLLGVTPWWSMHTTYPKPVIIPRHDGIWFAFECVEDNGSQHWKIGRFTDGVFQVMGRLPYGTVISYDKEDGWLLFMDRSDPDPFKIHTELLQMQFGPKLIITYNAQSRTANMDWKPFRPGDMLQEQVQGGEWQTPFVCVPPATVVISSTHKTFRVVQQVPIE